MTQTRHDTLTQMLHWATAILVISVYAIGFGREFLPKGDLKAWMLAQHIALGLVTLALVAIRILWRATASAIEPAPMSGPAHIAARFAHMGLYILMVAVPVIGLIAAFIKGRSVAFYGFVLDNPFTVNTASGKFLEGLHGYAAHLFIALIGLHACAALAHHYLLKDGVMRRMLPARAGQ